MKNVLLGKEDEIIKMYEGGNSCYKIADFYCCSPSSIHKLLIKRNVQTRSNRINSRKFKYDFNFFKVIDNEIKAYWLGFSFADGYISKNGNNFKFSVSMAEVDKLHMFRFKDDIKNESEVKKYEVTSGYKNGSIYYRMDIFGEEIYNDLYKFGLVPNKSLILEPPKNINKIFYPAFIRGFFDGNGSICLGSKTKNAIHYSIKIVSTEAFLDFLKMEIEKNEICKVGKYNKRRPTDIVTTLGIGGNRQVLKFLHYIYDDATVYLERKYQRFVDLQKQAVELSRNTKC